MCSIRSNDICVFFLFDLWNSVFFIGFFNQNANVCWHSFMIDLMNRHGHHLGRASEIFKVFGISTQATKIIGVFVLVLSRCYPSVTCVFYFGSDVL